MELMSVYGSSDLPTKVDASHNHHYRHRHNSAETLRMVPESEPVSNVGFHVDFKSHHRTPHRCVNELRHHLAGGNYKLEDCHSLSNSIQDLAVDLDQVESCLNAANHMDSSLAFFYMDENDKRTVKVSELFVYDEEDVLPTPQPQDTDMQDSHIPDMTWDAIGEQLHSEQQDDVLDIPVQTQSSEHNEKGQLSSRSASISRLIDAL